MEPHVVMNVKCEYPTQTRLAALDIRSPRQILTANHRRAYTYDSFLTIISTRVLKKLSSPLMLFRPYHEYDERLAWQH